MILRLLLFTILSVLLRACGGGGGDETPAASTQATTTSTSSAQSVAGLWVGSTSNNHAVVAISLSDGTIWALYSPIGNAGLIAGAVRRMAA